MSRLTKIFLATTLVVVGFGVAKFLGQPVLLPGTLRSLSAQIQPVSAATQTLEAKADASRATGSVRLLPDSLMAHSDLVATNAASAVWEAPGLGSELRPVLAANELTRATAMPRTFDNAPIDTSPLGESLAPRATLRNEAPRSVGIDPQSPAAIRRTPAVSAEVADSYQVADTQTKSVQWPAPQLINAGYSDAALGQAPPAIAASYSGPATSFAEGQAAPPLWPANDENAEPRTHIIVDGDTLEKLAGRYLTDPQRSREIYELNRGLLSSPDLLPIGAELKIPERVASASWGRQNWQPNASNPRATGAAGRDTTTPVQPASAPQGIIPRAQLARPVMVE